MQEKNYSKIYRIIHWAIAISFLFLLGTIFLRETWMNKHGMADIIENYLQGTDSNLSRDQVVGLAKQIRAPMWKWHIYFGYVLTGLFGIRFALPLLGSMKFQNPFVKDLTVKEKFKRWTYLVFYVCVSISLFTGLMIKLGPKDLKKAMEELHELSMFYLIPYIIIHLGGVLIAEFSNQKGIVSSIISGIQNKDKS